MSGRASFLRSLKKLPPSGRTAALHALALTEDGRTAQQALAEALSHTHFAALSAQERHLCAELTYGCLRAEIRIASLLSRVLPRPDGLPRPLLHILQMAVYALLFQERVPDHAAVHNAVEQSRCLFGVSLSRVANAALRSVQRLGPEVHRAEFYTDAKGGGDAAWDGLCRYYSLPRWMGNLWREAYGQQDALALMQRSFARPWTGLRVNARHARAADLRFVLREMAGEGEGPAPAGMAVGEWGVAFAPGCLPAHVLGQNLDFWRHEGALSFQSAGSQWIMDALALDQWAAPVWDVCAGFGGKSMALLERGVPLALCTDLSWQRLLHVPSLCAGLKLPPPAVCLADALRPPLAAWQGHILVDAPCSGLGVLARRPDIRKASRRTGADLTQLADLQYKMLLRLSALLVPGRELAYITCTLNPAENELLVERLLAARPELALLRQWQTPHTHSWLEGMYGAVLGKREAETLL